MRTREEKIENYLNGSLTDKELAEFDLQIGQDEALRREVEAHQLAQEVIIDHELIQLRNQVRTIINDKANYSPKNGHYKRWIIGVGAVIVSTSILWHLNSQREQPLNTSQQNETLLPPTDETATSETTPPIVSIEEESNKVTADNNNVPVDDTPQISESKNESDSFLTFELPPPIKRKNMNLDQADVTPTLTSADIQPIDPKLYIHDRPNLFLEMPKVINECKKGLIVLPPSWMKELNNNKVAITLLPGTINVTDDTLSNLNPGAYTLIAETKDTEKKSQRWSGVIYGDDCVEADYQAFSPERGEKWTFEIKNNASGSIAIVDKKGSLIKTLQFRSRESVYWDGYNNSGTMAGLGIYFYTISYHDKSEATRGSLYLIR